MIDDLQDKINQFIKERDWKQFHDHKNMAIAISVEANELLENFQWDKSDFNELSDERKKNVKNELADIMIYLLEFYDSIDEDIEENVLKKLDHNGEKYPVKKAKGSSLKYNEL